MVKESTTSTHESPRVPGQAPSRIKIPDVTGIILAGGKSNRYGTNKAFVKLEGIPLIERVTGVLDRIFPRLVLITNTPDEYAHLGLPMYEDLIKGLGPIGGIYTGLTVMKDEAAFFVACDMPFLKESLIRHIVASRDDYDAVIPRVDWKIEALHSLYHRRCLPIIKEQIDSRVYQVIRCFSKIRVKYIEEQVIRTFDPEFKTFININKPDDLIANLNQREDTSRHG